MANPARAFLLAALVLAAPVAAGAPAPDSKRDSDVGREDCAEHDPLRRPLFGDLHVHTAFSQDASTQGTRATPRDAYRFARGERLGLQPFDAEGTPLRSLTLARPLDFAAVTDHAEQLGEVHVCTTPGLAGHDSLVCRMYRHVPRLAFLVMNWWSSREQPVRFGFCGEEGSGCLAAARTPWGEIQAAAEAAYDRSADCRFTTFVGYEWTGSSDTNNLHRNVIFRNEQVPELPASFYETPTVEQLWQAIRSDCLEKGEGCDALVIPHNSNLSNGLMFQTTRSDGGPLTDEEARTRARMETLVEVMQHKGDSECHITASPEDELCRFEKLPFANFLQKYLPLLAEPPDPRSFVRTALQEGLVFEQQRGVNLFKLGLLGSTDTHLGAAGAVDERVHPGHGGAGAGARDEIPEGLPDDFAFNPGGLAAVWAEENSRESIFRALRRREVYGTSGPRIVMRFFGGWDYPAGLCEGDAFVETGYARGVPMGGDLPPPPPSPPMSPGSGAEGAAPAFAVWAQRDPGPPGRPGTALARLQIVKGWVEDDASHEAVYDVAGGVGGPGVAEGAGDAGVDPATCQPTGAGADRLCQVWRDPDFDPAQHAFYYARAVENPSCRWSHWVCLRHGVDCSIPSEVPGELASCCSDGVPSDPTIQERAWSSPIWYAPAAP